jgi:hypothetical protein
MSLFTRLRKSSLGQWARLGALASIGTICMLLAGQSPTKPKAPSNAIQTSAQWRMHETAAEAALQQASDCVSKALKSSNGQCIPSPFLTTAAAEYRQMEALTRDGRRHVKEVIVIGNGLIRSGEPAQAIEFLMNRSETATDPFLTHLLADALFAIGDHPNAALAYKAWIEMGCGGYLYSMQSNAVWIVPKTGDRCSHLPQVMRSRLEMLQDTSRGEPSNLPENNDPTGDFVSH